jgi:hypothetical protein
MRAIHILPAALASLTAAAPAAAATTILDFNPAVACTPACVPNSPISDSYGDQAGVDLSWSVARMFGVATSEPIDIQFATDIDVQGDTGAYARSNTIDAVGQIRFDVAPGFRLTLGSIFASTFAFDTRDVEFRVYDLAYNLLSSSAGTVPLTGGRTFGLTGTSTTGLILQFGQPGNATNGFAIDDLTFTVEPLATPAVPEPASWAMMIAGFGLVGGALRRRPVRLSYA